MSLLLHIDTAVEAASICLSQDTEIIAEARNEQSREGAAWLQPAIRDLFAAQGLQLQQLAAISVSAGPGSYTGLRVGMASAKGLCYALQVPLIAISTLEMMTAAATRVVDADVLFCPMIDARRMEVFTGIYNRKGDVLLPPQNMILDENSFSSWLQKESICFFGNGSAKLKPLISGEHAVYAEVHAGASDLAGLAFQCFKEGRFADLAYTEPFYIKGFFTAVPRS